MNKKILYIVGVLALGVFVLPHAITLEQTSEYVATTGIISLDEIVEGTTYKGYTQVQYLPVTAGATYTYSVKLVPIQIDMSKSIPIRQQAIADQVKLYGTGYGYNVTAVYEVDYVKIIPN